MNTFHTSRRIVAMLALLCGSIPASQAAGPRAAYVEQVLPGRPYKASMSVSSAVLARSEDTVFLGGTGAIGLTSITITNPDNRQKSVTVFEPAPGGLRECGTPVSAVPSSFVVMVPPSSTVHLTYPSPLVFNTVNGHTCFGMQVNELAGPVQVLLNGFTQ